jgi:multisubunit Na+/H+ antiporter MnhF subunit
MIDTARRGPATWLRAWSGRHTVAVIALAPVLFLVYRSAAGPTIVGDPAWTVLLGLISTVGAATVATYLPQPHAADGSWSSPCATLAGAHVVVAAVMLSTGPSVPMRGVLAFGMVLFALIQRLSGSATCSVR